MVAAELCSSLNGSWVGTSGAESKLWARAAFAASMQLDAQNRKSVVPIRFRWFSATPPVRDVGCDAFQNIPKGNPPIALNRLSGKSELLLGKWGPKMDFSETAKAEVSNIEQSPQNDRQKALETAVSTVIALKRLLADYDRLQASLEGVDNLDTRGRSPMCFRSASV